VRNPFKSGLFSSATGDVVAGYVGVACKLSVLFCFVPSLIVLCGDLMLLCLIAVAEVGGLRVAISATIAYPILVQLVRSCSVVEATSTPARTDELSVDISVEVSPFISFPSCCCHILNTHCHSLAVEGSSHGTWLNRGALHSAWA
jgi:hypothetical protein